MFIIDVPHKTNSRLKRKLIKLKCDECSVEFERKWQRETILKPTHCCSRQCGWKLRSKNKQWRERISSSTKKRMWDPDVRKRFEIGLETRSMNPAWQQHVIDAAVQRHKNDPELGKRTGLKMSENIKILIS